MEFTPTNPTIKLCIQGMAMEEKGKSDEAQKLLHQAFKEATHDFEKFIATHCLARHQKNISGRLKWLEASLEYALKTHDDTVRSAFTSLHSDIARCYEDLGQPDKAKEHRDLATASKDMPLPQGPFYHGTKADLKVGDLLTAGGDSNYKDDLRMNHIYFTAMVSGAGLAATLAKGEGRERVYVVEPTGSFENDPNVTDKKFPGNLTRSFRSEAPLLIVGEVTDWMRQPPEELQKWRERLATNKGDIIN